MTAVEAEPEITEDTAVWAGVIGNEGQLTGDGRFIQPNALRWDTPIPLRWAAIDNGGHQGAQVVGQIQSIERRSNGDIWGEGVFDLGSEVGREASRMVDTSFSRGISMDLDDVSFEVRVKAEALEQQEPVVNDDGTVTVLTIASDDEVMVTTSARIRAATLVSIPAIIEAEVDSEMSTLTAAAVTAGPPPEWFMDPGLSALTALTVTDDGHIFGHLAAWESCHIGYAGECKAPPTSDTNYAYFRTGATRTSDGQDVPTGHITLDTLHAGGMLSARDTVGHYEDTGAVVADVTVGEDDHGIWFSGAIRDIGDTQLRKLRATPLSGDWRRIGGNLELVAALGVNVPGFPIPRVQGLVAGGHMESLVAAGMLAPNSDAVHEVQLSTEALGYLQRLAHDGIAKERTDRMSAMRRKVAATALAVRITEGMI